MVDFLEFLDHEGGGDEEVEDLFDGFAENPPAVAAVAAPPARRVRPEARRVRPEVHNADWRRARALKAVMAREKKRHAKTQENLVSIIKKMKPKSKRRVVKLKSKAKPAQP